MSKLAALLLSVVLVAGCDIQPKTPTQPVKVVKKSKPKPPSKVAPPKKAEKPKVCKTLAYGKTKHSLIAFVLGCYDMSPTPSVYMMVSFKKTDLKEAAKDMAAGMHQFIVGTGVLWKLGPEVKDQCKCSANGVGVEYCVYVFKLVRGNEYI